VPEALLLQDVVDGLCVVEEEEPHASHEWSTLTFLLLRRKVGQGVVRTGDGGADVGGRVLRVVVVGALEAARAHQNRGPAHAIRALDV
jgi:hypothetical protein